jgi:hypothetical protein
VNFAVAYQFKNYLPPNVVRARVAALTKPSTTATLKVFTSELLTQIETVSIRFRKKGCYAHTLSESRLQVGYRDFSGQSIDEDLWLLGYGGKVRMVVPVVWAVGYQ